MRTATPLTHFLALLKFYDVFRSKEDVCNTQIVCAAKGTFELHLQALAAELEERTRRLILTGGLRFATPPAIGVPVPEVPTMDPNDLGLHRLSLQPDELANISVLEYEQWLLVAMKEVLPHSTSDDIVAETLSVNLEEAFRNLQLHKVEEWERQREDAHLRVGLKVLSDSLARPEVCNSFETGTHTRFRPWITT